MYGVKAHCAGLPIQNGARGTSGKVVAEKGDLTRQSGFAYGLLVKSGALCPKGPRKNNYGIRGLLHPLKPRCSSVETSKVAPSARLGFPGASALSVLRSYSCADPNSV